MKIGVALSGCDIGGICAWSVLSELEACGLKIDMISSCCVPAVTALLYANRYTKENMKKISQDFLKDIKELDIDFAVANFSASFKNGEEDAKIPLCINAVNVSDGESVAFTDCYFIEGENLKTFAERDPYDILSATISLVDGLGCYNYEGNRLCDSSCWYGCPVHQLKLGGIEKIISVSFLPMQPKTPYEVLSKKMICSTACPGDIHIPIEFEDGDFCFEEYEKIAVEKIRSSIKDIMLKLLF